MRVSRITALRLLLIALIIIVPITWALWVAHAATRFWTGNGLNNRWNTDANWKGNVAPSAGDDLVFGSSNQANSDNNFAIGTTFNSISVSDGHNMTGASVSLNSGITATFGTIDLSSIKLNNNQTFNATAAGTGLTIRSPIDNNGKTLTLDGPGNFSITGSISGTGSLLKMGSGRTQLFGANSYSGLTSVSAGTLLVFGDQHTSNVQLSGGATLGGEGTVGGITFSGTQGGSIRPGQQGGVGAAILTANGNVSFPDAGLGSFDVELNGASVGGYDQLKVNGTVSLGLVANTALNVDLHFTPQPGATFTIIDNDGTDAVSGTFANKPEGSSFTIGANATKFFITYRGGDGNDVVLHVPQIKTWDGGGTDNNWKTGANWVGDVAPQLGDDLIFPAGKPQMSNNNDFPAGTPFSSITISGNGYTLNGASLKLSGNFTNNPTSGGTNTVNLAILSAAALTSAQDFLSLGLSELILNGNNTYAGVSSITGGIMTVNGFQPNSPIDIIGGSLHGVGTGGHVTAGSGSIRPSISSASSDVTLTVNGVDCSGGAFIPTFLGGPGGVQNSQLGIIGTLNLNQCGIAFTAIDVFSLPAGTNYTIVNNDLADPINGTFTNKPEGSVFPGIGGSVLGITYVGGDGNDVVLHVPTTRTWDGGGTTNNWKEAANWEGDFAPGPGDDLIFPPGAARLSNNNNIPAGTTFNSISFTGGGYIITGNAIALNGGASDNHNTVASNLVHLPIVLKADQSFTATGGATRLSFFSSIENQGHLLTLAGDSVDLLGIVSGSGGLVKNGEIVSLLGANNTYTGATRIINGSLRIDGSQPSSAVQMTNGTLLGSGTIGPLTATGGRIAPIGANFVAVFNVNGNVDLGTATFYDVGLRGTVPGSGHDQLNVAGAVNLGGCGLSVSLLGGYTPLAGDKFIIVNNDGADQIVGTFNGLPEGSIVTAGSQQFTISYVGGDGNDVAMTTLPPTLFIEEGTTNRAVALDSVTFVRGPFRLIDDHNFSADHRTRVILFTSLLGLTQPDPSVLVVQAGGFNLPVENVGTLTAPGLVCSFIIVRLPDGLPPGDLPMAFTLRGVISNTAILSISP